MANRELVDRVFQQDTFQNDAFQVYDVLFFKTQADFDGRTLSTETKRSLSNTVDRDLAGVGVHFPLSFPIHLTAASRQVEDADTKTLSDFTGRDLA